MDNFVGSKTGAFTEKLENVFPLNSPDDDDDASDDSDDNIDDDGGGGGPQSSLQRTDFVEVSSTSALIQSWWSWKATSLEIPFSKFMG